MLKKLCSLIIKGFVKVLEAIWYSFVMCVVIAYIATTRCADTIEQNRIEAEAEAVEQ